ncbi:unnamed protein product [Bursaphelenchus xylophilus]|uniref:(pine wood nematode) hypothetical protein n=1 Tax=Bursaphelenchus xylophilus TaxID=6326 RepID=A0A1I7SGG7_BURXY|nr:unnamed protein product [Bursaphelenchus xylophilus]CAG9109746.1 unnamed protein product [Bursaphelenchus xylophilus]
MDGGSLTSSATTSDCESIESMRQLQNVAAEPLDSFLNTNDRLCSALLWSAKIAASTEQKQLLSCKNRKLNWKNPALYKTRLCDYWSTGNACKFGLNCWYAHGPLELRHVPRLDKDPVATSISLAEVVQRLPPSRDRSIAMEQAENQLIANIKSDAFAKHAIQGIAGSGPSSAPPIPKSPVFFPSDPGSPVKESFPKPSSTSRLPFFEQITARSNNFQPRQSQLDPSEAAFHAYQPYLNELVGSSFSQTSNNPQISLFEDPRWRF